FLCPSCAALDKTGCALARSGQIRTTKEKQMARVIRVHRLGGPEVLQIEEMEVGEPGLDEVRIRVSAVGLNRAEAMYRAGRYPVKPELPSLIGYEGVGTIEAVG